VRHRNHGKPARRRLKAERSPDSNAERVEKWTELAEATFTLAAASAWALPLLDLLLRVQINVLGRHLYFASLRNDSPCALPVNTSHNRPSHFPWRSDAQVDCSSGPSCGQDQAECFRDADVA